ncbi:MAG: hypothetical protein K2N56_00110 [Oscillospiraceae bacterium]|nr:hypothetical protein [Oscillospiraceae bacterium]
MNRIAVIDTETTWGDEVMSIGIAIADPIDFGLVDMRYYILTPFKNYGGMYTDALYINGIKPYLENTREAVTNDIKAFLAENEISAMFAYNAIFDHHHLPELQFLKWHDIMKAAANRRYNSKIPSSADCFKTGKLKRGYGVESIYRMLSGRADYRELHNALTDAVDELEIMRMLGLKAESYAFAEIH